MTATLIIAEAVVFAVGYLIRPTIDELRAERRFRRHCAACEQCHRVRESNGPAWLYCRESGIPFEARQVPDEFEARARRALRESMDAVPMTRSRDVR